MKYEKLFEPGYVGSLKLDNRIFRSAAGTESADNSRVTPENIALYRAWGRGGVGLVVVEGIFSTYELDVYPPDNLRLDSDEYLPGMRELYEAVHEGGAKVFQQIMHLGTWNLAPGSIPISASPLSDEENPPMEQPFPPTVPPRGVTKEEIQAIEDDFVDMALRIQRAGADGIEINAAGAHFLNSFLSRVWNKRDDEYGPQSFENRARIVCEIIQKIKAACGEDYPVTVLYNGQESGIGEKGTTVEEGVEFGKLFEKAGADALQVRNYGYGEDTARQWIENSVYPEPVKDMPATLDWSRDGAGAYIPLAKAVKDAVSIPVAVVGRVEPDIAEAALERGDIDFVAMQRRLIADPDMPNKLKAGHPEDVKPCTACLYCASSPGTGRLICRVNPSVGLPEDFALVPTEHPKRVAIVGGGPGGLEAARVAAERGHAVTLFERSKKLGGYLHMATMVKGVRTENLPELLAYYERQMQRLGVDVRLNTEFTPDMAEGYDAVIVATGGKDATFEIPGIEKRTFVSNETLHKASDFFLRFFNPLTLRKLTKIFMPVGKNVIVIGGTIHGAEMAEFLALRGRNVTIVSQGPLEDIGKGMASIKLVYLMNWFEKNNVRIVTDVKEFKEITDAGLVIINSAGEEELLPADTVTTALPLEPNTALYDAIAAEDACDVYKIGDCNLGDGLILDAISQGFGVANAL